MPISNFNDILNMPTESLPKAKPWPVGTYEVVVHGNYEVKEMDTKNGPASRLHFPLRALKAMPDVDLTALAEMGGLEEKFPDFTVWLGYNDEEAMKNAGRAREFVEACGQPIEGIPYKVALESTINSRCMVVIKHATSSNNRTVANIVRAFKVG